MEIYIALGVVLLFLALVLCFLKPKKKKITAQNLSKFTQALEATNKLDPNHALIEAHKIFVAAIRTIIPQEKATAAQIITQVCKRFPNEKSVWRLHRLRNQAAHQTNFTVYEKTASEARLEFTRALRSLS